MIAPRVQTQPKPNVAGPKSSPATVATMPNIARSPVSSPDQIRERAYELYQGRGCEPGQDQQDWLRAEQEILDRKP